MFQRILLAVDSSDARAHALATVTPLAERFGSSVHVVHVAPTAVVSTAVLAIEEDEDARRVLDETLTALRDAGVKADGELLSSLTVEVPAAISAAAERVDADLLVLSPHHRRFVASWLTPSVSAAVAHAARVPVLLVPEAS
ncbi:universal stress protein [Streptacidiphilus fuscans]|uniref:Universal stress protein n=1 Tax=Streptacidiphilus fuscans TaxID=2789292 RepID=A0A931AWD2_9ACTN|nr:universal stress protein [Streptacidiphilus fuscans]MBF9066700.1 universal stress protein [Streptacidiphilus fuscans]